jgi:uncharacterized membrane protein
MGEAEGRTGIDGQDAGGSQAAQPPIEVRAATRPGPLRVLRRWFLTGLIVLLPAAISVFVLWRLFFGLDRILGPYVEQYLNRHIPGIGLVALLLLIIVIGAVASNFIGRKFIQLGERVVERIPVVRWIYRTTKGLFSTVLHERSTSFRKVVLVPFPDKGSYSLAFQTAEDAGQLGDAVGRPMITVFLPTTPNPTSGFFLVVPQEDVITLPMTVNEGLRLVISAGALTREGNHAP